MGTKGSYPYGMNPAQLNILLADDDYDDRNFFSDALKQLSSPTNLKVVPDGEKLMELLTGESTDLPDVLFLDINMPRKGGFECLSEIKANPKLKDIPVIMFSTSKAKDGVGAAFRTGAAVYIHKPGDFKELVQVIHHALHIASENVFSSGPIKYILNA
jgi:CheY-like chemotaxis protein